MYINKVKEGKGREGKGREETLFSLSLSHPLMVCFIIFLHTFFCGELLVWVIFR
jgi:hypothetical protein